jgi:hypothetical protein
MTTARKGPPTLWTSEVMVKVQAYAHQGYSASEAWARMVTERDLPWAPSLETFEVEACKHRIHWHHLRGDLRLHLTNPTTTILTTEGRKRGLGPIAFAALLIETIINDKLILSIMDDGK